VAFIGYAMMVNFFVPLLMHDHGFLPFTASTAQRTSVRHPPRHLSDWPVLRHLRYLASKETCTTGCH
jgi:hypothetical protein